MDNEYHAICNSFKKERSMGYPCDTIGCKKKYTSMACLLQKNCAEYNPAYRFMGKLAGATV